MLLDENLMNLLDDFFEGIYVLDKQRKIIFWNKEAEKITGYEAKEVVGKSCRDNLLKDVDKKGNELCINDCPMVFAMNKKIKVEDEVFLHHKNGFRLLVRVKGIPIIEDNEAKGLIELFVPKGFTREYNHIDDLIDLAYRDSLTEAYNRKGFDFIYPLRQREMELLGFHRAILFFDIDDFKKINDTYGHDVGDKVLIAVAQTFIKSLRRDDMVIRWGGEEFVLILFFRKLGFLNEIGRKLVKLIESTFIHYSDKIIKITISGGGTYLRKEEDIHQAINRADRLMYEAKKKGKNQFISDLK